MEFRAKDIQKHLGIPKYRYEYLATKIGIRPEILEVDGQGKSHLYSFRNLLQFAFVDVAGELGLSPKNAGGLLRFIDWLEKIYEVGIYDPHQVSDLSIHFVIAGVNRFYKVTGETREASITEGYYPVEIHPFLDSYSWVYKGTHRPSGAEEMAEVFKQQKQIATAIAEPGKAHGYLTINIGIIKSEVLSKI